MNKTYPQDKAEIIGKYSCLAMCYLFCVGIDGTDADYLKYVSDAMDKGLLDPVDCSVNDADLYLKYFTGKRYKVIKKECTSIAGIKAATPVRFYYYDANNKKHEHWIVVENGEIVFNSIKESMCVKIGKPDVMRVITLAN